MNLVKKLIVVLVLISSIGSMAAANEFQTKMALIEAQLQASADPLCDKNSVYECLPDRTTIYIWLTLWVVQTRLSVILRDQQGRVQKVVIEEWNEGDEIWEEFGELELFYTLFGAPSEIVQSSFDGTTLTPSFRSRYTYDQSNRVSEIISELYNSGIWSPTSRTTNTYSTARGELTEAISQSYFLNTWQNTQRRTYEYGAAGLSLSAVNPTVENRFIWIVSSWQSFERSLFTYNGNGDETLELAQGYVAPNWIDSRRFQTMYNGSLPTSYTEQLYTGTAWENVARDLYGPYDGENRLTELISQNWDGDPLDWVNDSRTTLEYDSPTDVDDEGNAILPNGTALSQNYPNPFNPSTTISYSLSERSDVTLAIYDMLGRKVVDLAAGQKAAGEYSVTWDGKDANGEAVATGVYFYKLSTGAGELSKKLLMVK